MADPLILWRDVLVAIFQINDRGWVEHEVRMIDNGGMPEVFYTLGREDRIIAFGLGSGASIFRLATWDLDRSIVCIEHDVRARQAAQKVAADYGLRNLSFLGSFDELEAVVGFTLLLYEPVIRNTELNIILESNPGIKIIGKHYEDLGGDDKLFYMCSKRASAFWLTNLGRDTTIVARGSRATRVSVIVDASRCDAILERCIASLVAQTVRPLEVIIAHGRADSSATEFALGWKAREPDVVKLCVVDVSQSGELIAAAIASAVGDYVSIVDAGDWCEPLMFERLLGVSGPYNAEISFCSYYRVRPEDNMRFIHVGPGPHWIQDPAGLIEPSPVMGRFLFDREFLSQNKIGWPVGGPQGLQAVAFQAACLVAAERVYAIPEAYYNCRGSADIPDLDLGIMEWLTQYLRTRILADGSYRTEMFFKSLLLRLHRQIQKRETKWIRKFVLWRLMVRELFLLSIFVRPVDYLWLRMRRSIL